MDNNSPEINAEINAVIWQEIRQFFPGDTNQAGTFTTMAGDNRRSARIATDASGLLHTEDGGNLLLSLDDIANGDDLMVIAVTRNEEMPADDREVFTTRAWALCDTFSPVAHNVLRDTLGEPCDTTRSLYTQAWPLTDLPGGR